MRITIETMAHGGSGVGKIFSKAVFVQDVLPGEIVDIEIIDDKKSYSTAKPIRIVKPSKFRVVPECQYYNSCGGCDFQHIEYPFQLILKKDILKNVLKRLGSIEFNDIKVVESDDIFNYRKRVKFSCDGAQWGFYKKGSNEVVSIDSCLIADEKINEYIKDNNCKNSEIGVDDTGNINAKTMILNLSEIEPGLYLTFRQGAFIQVNKNINLKLIKAIIDVIKREKISEVFDFYSGIGNLSLPLAYMGVKVAAFDSDKKSIDSFNKNSDRLGLKNSAKAFVKNLNRKFIIDKKCPECVILDPPRAGAKKVVEYIMLNKPKHIFYVSCEPSTLARDLKILKDCYILKKVILFDMFPQTHHFETFVKLERL